MRYKRIVQKTVLDDERYLALYPKLSIKTNRSISKDGYLFHVKFRTGWRGFLPIKDALENGPSSSCNDRNWFFPIYLALRNMDPEDYKVRYGDCKIHFKKEEPLYKFIKLMRKYDKKGSVESAAKIIVLAPRHIVTEEQATDLSKENLIERQLPQIYKPRADGRFYVQAKSYAFFKIEDLEKVRDYCRDVGINYSKYALDKDLPTYKEKGRTAYWGNVWFAVDELSMLGFLTLRDPRLTHRIYINSAHGVDNGRRKKREEKTDQVS